MYDSLIRLILVGLLVQIPGFAQGQDATIGKELSSPISFTDLEGNEYSLPCSKEKLGIVLVFITTECPIANSYHPTLHRIRNEFLDSRFDFVMVHADPDLKPEVARKHQRDYEIHWPIVLDAGNRIARKVQAKVTPEAIIIGPKGNVIYRGRIDDRHQSYGRKRPEPTSNDLQLAMRAIVEGKPVPSPETKPIGCVIRYQDE